MIKWKEAAGIAPRVIQDVFTLGLAAHRGGLKAAQSRERLKEKLNC